MIPNHWKWPLPGVNCDIPIDSHPGAFASIRRYDVHTGVDLYCEIGQQVVAVEDGIVVCIEAFTGASAGSPWWNETSAVLVEGKSGVVLYGELQEAKNITVGSTICAGDLLGNVLRVLKHDRGRPTTMLHLELYKQGTRSSTWWRHNEQKPNALCDPTMFLVFAAFARNALYNADESSVVPTT
jgi:murein DD-endopeptidase MepM/ murein hydrolase activator NlpD